MAAAKERRRRMGRRTIVFVDEIHRFNKAQQDAFLPHVEGGDITLIGATTENPSFAVNAALLSRSKVFPLQPLTSDAVERSCGGRSPTPSAASADGARASRRGARAIARFAHGDARRRSTCSRSRPPAPRAGDVRSAAGSRSSTRSSAGRCSTTRPARSTTTSFRRFTSRCAAAIRTPPSTGWCACSKRARIRSTSPVVSFASQRGRRQRRSPGAVVAMAADAVLSWECRKEHALAQAAIYLATAPKSTRSTPPTRLQPRMRTRSRLAGAYEASQCADELMKHPRVRLGLPVRTRRPRCGHRHGRACRHRSPTRRTTGRRTAASRKRSRRRLDAWEQYKQGQRSKGKGSKVKVIGRACMESQSFSSSHQLSSRDGSCPDRHSDP